MKLRPTNGFVSVQMKRWQEFQTFIDRDLPKAQEYIWRGHRRVDWKLEPTIDRLKPPPQLKGSELHRSVLTEFRRAVVGRRGINPRTLDSNEMWALGQHFGLATPLLDWTRSPFAAAFFAFCELKHATKHRAIFGLHRDAVLRANRRLKKGLDDLDGPPTFLRIVLPLVDENARLVSQGGYFTKAPARVTIEEWIQKRFQGIEEPILIRLELPNSQRLSALRSLNRMNINYASLFPDLEGAARYVNLSHVIADY